MSDAIAPAGATSAGPQTSSTPTPPASNGQNGAGTASPKPGPSSTPRATDGRFLPKGGTQPEGGDGPQQADETSEQAEARKEAYRFKRAIKVFGKEELVDLGEDDIARELQLSRSRAKKERDWDASMKKAQRLFQLAESDPEGFLREVGKQDPSQWARERMAQEAQLASMNEDQRRAFELEQELTTLKAEKQERTQAEEQAQKAHRAEAAKQQLQQTFLPALEKAGLPKSYETLYLMAETAKLGLQDGIDYTPEELAKETTRRIDAYTERFLGALDGSGLVKRLGPQRVQAILDAVVQEHLKSQDVVPAARAAAAAPEPQEDERIDEFEVNRRLREMRARR